MSCSHGRRTIWCLLGAIAASVAHADEFRVETFVYVGNQKEAIAQNVTFFTNGLVYDFPLTGPEEITVFDASRGRFVLLDCRRKVKTTLTTKDLIEFTSAQKAHAAEADGVFAFAANPRFQHKYDTETDSLTLTGKLMTYRAKGMRPKIETAVSTYRDFADWYARLNATRPGSLPPFARFELNKAIAEKGMIPKEVELTVAPKMRIVGRKLVMRSRHMANWRLSDTDRERIETAGTYLVSFQPVSFKDYRAEAQVAAK